MPWPGAPKSQQSPPINPPSMRRDPSAGLNEHSSIGDVVGALRTAFNGLTVHEQAFANLPSQIASQASAAATAAVENITNESITGVTSFNTQTGAVIFYPNLGMTNSQLGNTAYLTQTSDAGQKLIMGDSSPVTVTLNPQMMAPWFCFIGNDSSATVHFATDSGATVSGLTSLYTGGFAVVFYDGGMFWVEGFPGGATGTIPLGPVTDSGATGHISVLNGAIIGWVSPT